ncbi:MAG TPA: sialidase family protein [Gemmatimonadales bacterium]
MGGLAGSVLLGAAALLGVTQVAAQAPLAHPAVIRSEFIYTGAPIPSAHASTIADTPQGLVAAWFGGSREGADDVAIWLSRLVGGEWTAPVPVATGAQPDGRRFPCWNPVLAPWPDGTLRLFYKVGPSPARWWGMWIASRDGGQSWGPATRLPEGILGPVKNKPVQLASGVILSGSSTETADPDSRWRVHFERSADSGRSWSVVTPAPPNGPELDAIQPAILVHSAHRLQALGRTRSGYIFESWSLDEGKHWGPLTLTRFPNPNAGIDAVTLRDGRHLLVYNNTRQGRTPLNLALSPDGRAWTGILELETEPGEYSYPAVIQARDGMVHITYTWNRNRIMHVVLDPAQLPPR